MSVLPHEGGPYPVLYRSYGVPSGSGYRPGYVARPDATGRFPGVVMLAPSGGVKAQTKSVAWQLARRGFSIVAIDPAAGSDETSDRSLLGAVSDAIGFALTEEAIAAGSVGLWGFGAGGRVALIAAARLPNVAAVVVTEAPLRGDDTRENKVQDVLERVVVPVLGFYGQDGTNPADVDEAQAKVPYSQWILYEGVGAGFLDPDSDGYHEGAAHDAVVRAARLFEVSLPAPAEAA